MRATSTPSGRSSATRHLQEQAKIRAFLWTPGATDGDPANPQMRNLGVSAAESYDASYATGITDDGWVTGHVGQFGSRTFIWVPTAPNATTGGIIDGLTLGGTFSAATGINDAKQIAGWSFLSGNQEYIDPVIGFHPIIHAFVTAPAGAEKFAQTITFGALANKAFGDPDFAVTAAASSGLPVSFTADGACELTGSLVHITGNGTCTITASQAGNDNFDPATPVLQSFDIIGTAPLPQTITFAPMPNKVAGDPDFAVTATASSGLTVGLGAFGNCTISGTTVHLTGVGMCRITASQPGDSVYAAAASVRRSFSITATPLINTLVDIGTLGGVTTESLAINAYGQVVGFSYVPGTWEKHAFLWTPSSANGTAGTMKDLRELDGVFNTAYGINDDGQVVGVTSIPDADDQAFLWTPETPNGQTGNMTLLGSLGGGFSEAAAINNAGQVAGSSSNDPAHPFRRHAFLWTESTGMIDLGTLGGAESTASAISSDGKVVGWSMNADGVARPFIWTPDTPNGTEGEMVDLGSLNGADGFPSGINAAGQVVGTVEIGNDLRAFLWTAADGQVSLGTLDGDGYSMGFGINEAGAIVGISSVGGSTLRPFIWTPSTPNGTTGTMSDLLTLGGSLTSARGINGLGQIAGASTLDGDPTMPLQGLNIPITHAFVSALPTSTQAQAITFDEIADKVFGDVDFTVTATASSGLTVSFAAQGQCTSMGATVHLTGAGDCTITASQAGNATYAPASDVPRSFSIAKGSQAPVVIGAPSSLTYGNTATLTASGGSGSGTVTFSAGASTGCIVAGDQLSVTNAAGTCAVTATKAGDDNYLAASSNAASVTLNKASATLSLSNLTQAFDGTPKSVTVTTTPAGLTTVTVTYNGSTTPPTTAGSYAVVAALANGNYQSTNATGTLIITALAAVKKVALSAASVVGGAGVTATVTLAAKAPAGGVVLPLSSSNAAVASVPAAVTIPAGATSGSFPVPTQNVSAPQSVAISAGGKTASLTVTPAALVVITLNPKTLVGGGSVTATVTLNGPAPAGGAPIALASSHAAATVPAFVVVPAGQTSAPFTIVTSRVTGNVKATISATYNGVVQKATLTITR